MFLDMNYCNTAVATLCRDESRHTKIEITSNTKLFTRQLVII